jgi:hypothetical protein
LVAGKNVNTEAVISSRYLTTANENIEDLACVVVGSTVRELGERYNYL